MIRGILEAILKRKLETFSPLIFVLSEGKHYYGYDGLETLPKYPSHHNHLHLSTSKLCICTKILNEMEKRVH